MEKSLQQCKEEYDHAILRLREELSSQEKERDNIASKFQDSEARGAQRDKELGELQASLEAALREKVALADKVEQSSSQISQLETDISGLKEWSKNVTRELVTSRGLLADTYREIATLAAAKSEAKQNVVAYREDAATAHAMVRDISLATGKKLARAVEHAKAKAKAKREVLEELEARGFELSADLKEALMMEGTLAILIVPDGGEDDSGEE
uniref:Tropomyosin-like n=1 Tax=Nicotiana tabacum TaxID=4097 RepID=A0A1S4DFQ6_TOBAC|nr:PREDICTED: tropomyosin-like [Nicotiana tabacum]